MKKIFACLLMIAILLTATVLISCDELFDTSGQQTDGGGNNNADNDSGSNNNSSSSATMGQRNALRSAKNYLRTMPFSYTGLINQLEFEGYSTEEATYAADNCGADWFEQAAKSAKNYLKIMSFSKQGLIDQLEFEGYTHEQAVYGAEANGY